MEQENHEEELMRHVDEVTAAYTHSMSRPSLISDQSFMDQGGQFSAQIRTIFTRFEMGIESLLGLVLELIRESEPGSEVPLTRHYTDALTHLIAMATALRTNSHYCIEVLVRGESLHEALELTDTELDTLYQGVKYLFEQQYYVEAAAAFSFLTFLSPAIPIFWMGLGTAEYHLQRYEAALLAYAMAAQANGLDPLPHLFSAQCYELLNEKERALHSLELARLVLTHAEQLSEMEVRQFEQKIDAKCNEMKRKR